MGERAHLNIRALWCMQIAMCVLLVFSYVLYYNSYLTILSFQRRRVTSSRAVGPDEHTNTSAINTDTAGDFSLLAVDSEAHEPKCPEIEVESGGHCRVPSAKSWKKGVVTELEPRISRDCDRLAANIPQEVLKMKKLMHMWHNKEFLVDIAEKLSNCSYIHEEFDNNFYISKEEEEFPLAFIFVVYSSPQQIFRLLKAIYRPHNVYCIHPDRRQGPRFSQLFHSLSQCLHNVIVATSQVDVYWGHYSIMNAQMNCMKDLLHRPTPHWKYVINLCGKELPLRTNREIVQSLKKLNGESAVDIMPLPQYEFWDRFSFKTKIENYQVVKTDQSLGPVPHGIKLYKSFTFVGLTPPFVRYMFTNRVAVDFHNYMRLAYIPEEEYYASLFRLPGTPGGCPVEKRSPVAITTYLWIQGELQNNPSHYCAGRVVHGICIVTSGDLHRILHHVANQYQDIYFVNKYFAEDDHVIMDCMEERLVRQNMVEYARDCS